MMRSLPLVAARLRLPVAAAAALIVLSGCAAGQDAETSQDYDPADGRNVNVPADATFDDDYVAVRNALVVSDGGAASITVTLVNNGSDADVLTEAKIGEQTASFVGGPVEIAPGEGRDRRRVGAIALVQEGDVAPGDFAELTLVFTRAGTTTIDVVVRDEYVPDPDRVTPVRRGARGASGASAGCPSTRTGERYASNL